MSAQTIEKSATPALPAPSPAVAHAALQSLIWLVFANAIGVLLAVLLLLPGLNPWLGEWTYGRWMMVHMNGMLYGWSSLPMLGFLFRVYGADRGATAAWCRPVVWAWSAALVLGALSWLNGHSSGKLFLDWSGPARIAFPLAALALWLLLAVAFFRGPQRAGAGSQLAGIAKAFGLLILLAVPFALFLASSPGIYPAINPDTGGPTGTSQLESSLAVVLILLLVPYGVTRRKGEVVAPVRIAWLLLIAESLLCAGLSRADISHRVPSQFMSLGAMVLWLPLAPAYYAAFEWHANTRPWQRVMLIWWGALVVSGWIFFLPGVLDHFKFTDGLVGHSFVAMAGFLSALIILVMVQQLGEGGWIFTRTWSFHLWNWSVLGYILVITIAGWLEGSDPAFTIVLSPTRNLLYILRLLTGILMLVASAEWLRDAFVLIAGFDSAPAVHIQEKIA
jgi:cytochrome c oxidase cbb3-type subunit 1